MGIKWREGEEGDQDEEREITLSCSRAPPLDAEDEEAEQQRHMRMPVWLANGEEGTSWADGGSRRRLMRFPLVGDNLTWGARERGHPIVVGCCRGHMARGL
jgi:hypothetical protein